MFQCNEYRKCTFNRKIGQMRDRLKQTNFKPLQPSLIYFQTGSATAPPLPLYIADSKEVSQGILFLLKRYKF